MTTLEVIGIAVGMTATVITGIWFVFAKVFKLGKERQHLEEFESKVTEKFDSLEKSIDSIKHKLDSLPCPSHHDDLTRIKAVLIQKYPTSATIFSAKASPRRLNALGQKLFDDIKGEQFLEANKEELFKSIAATNPQVALDVEQAALSACSTIATTPVFNEIKNYIYNAPSIDLPDDGGKYDIAIPDVCFVLSLRLRDMYLTEKKLG